MRTHKPTIESVMHDRDGEINNSGKGPCQQSSST